MIAIMTNFHAPEFALDLVRTALVASGALAISVSPDALGRTSRAVRGAITGSLGGAGGFQPGSAALLSAPESLSWWT